ncbi:hypothetical protein CTI12_AA063730 [Artemisia annua]|uniref:Uncharacterized protein n=1 Tax=Artemisia annua TaxID=35608 RepID=A0A2U1Q7X8_ARTAN|nr:hypothetical protein CTI12_AA063730 [Artemisia annua]
MKQAVQKRQKVAGSKPLQLQNREFLLQDHVYQPKRAYNRSSLPFQKRSIQEYQRFKEQEEQKGNIQKNQLS